MKNTHRSVFLICSVCILTFTALPVRSGAQSKGISGMLEFERNNIVTDADSLASSVRSSFTTRANRAIEISFQHSRNSEDSLNVWEGLELLHVTEASSVAFLIDKWSSNNKTTYTLVFSGTAGARPGKHILKPAEIRRIDISPQEAYVQEKDSAGIVRSKKEKISIRMPVVHEGAKITEYRDERKKVMGLDCFKVVMITPEITAYSEEVFRHHMQTMWVTEQIHCLYHPVVTERRILERYFPVEVSDGFDDIRGAYGHIVLTKIDLRK